jgi:hypothetical protein
MARTGSFCLGRAAKPESVFLKTDLFFQFCLISPDGF